MARVGVVPPLGMFVLSVWIWLPQHIIKSLSQRSSGFSSSVSAGTKVKVVDTREKSESVADFLLASAHCSTFCSSAGTVHNAACQMSGKFSHLVVLNAISQRAGALMNLREVVRVQTKAILVLVQAEHDAHSVRILVRIGVSLHNPI